MAAMSKRIQKKHPRKQQEDEKHGSRMSKKKGAEKGPTKREMREELERKKRPGNKGQEDVKSEKDDKKSSKDIKRPDGDRKRSDGDRKRFTKDMKKSDSDGKKPTKERSDRSDSNGSPAESKNKLRDKLRVERRKADRKKKSQAADKAPPKHGEKVIYTEENINAFLLDAKTKGPKEKTQHMLLFLFKRYRTRPDELLAKIKVLTSDKKVEDEDDVHGSVLRHLLTYLEIEGDLKEGLFALLRRDTLLARYTADFLFSSTFNGERYDYYFDVLCGELAKTVEKTSTLQMGEYLDIIGEIDGYETVEKYSEKVAKDVLGDEDNVADDQDEDNKPVDDMSADDQDEVSNEEDKPANDIDALEESSISLVSLNDDAEIERIDRQLGNMFRKPGLSNRDEKTAINLMRCIEMLVKKNYAVKAENLIRVLYFIKFDCISNVVKFVVKDLLSKVNDPSRVFRIYQMCSLTVPECYQLFGLFHKYCGGDFDLKAFMTSVFRFGQEDLLVTKVGLDRFNAIYDSTLGQPFDDFLMALIRCETHSDNLRKLEGQYFSVEIKEVISESLKRFKAKTSTKAD